MYRRYVLPALLGLALSSALPPSLPVLAIDYSKVERLDTTWKQYSFEEFCNDFNPEGNNDPSLAEPLWKDHGVGKWFDSWLANTPDKRRWTETMDSEVNRNGASGMRCDTYEKPCPAPDDCKFHYDQGMGPAYWVLFSAARFHEGLRHLRQQMFEGSFNATIDVDEMVYNFGLQAEEETDTNPLGILSALFTVAAGAIQPAVGPLTVIAGLFALGSLFYDPEGAPPPPDPATAIIQQTRDAFASAIYAGEKAIEHIFFKENGVDNTGLPGQQGEYTHSLARLFAEGKFLGRGVTEDLVRLSQEFSLRHEQALSAQIMATMGYVITAANDVEKAEDCRGDRLVSSWFQESTGRCFRVMKKNGEHRTDPHMVDGPVSVAINSYHFNHAEFYTNAYECAENNPDGDGKISSGVATLPTDGSLPACFFNVPVVSGFIETHDNGDNAYVKCSELDTTGMPTDQCGSDGKPIPVDEREDSEPEEHNQGEPWEDSQPDYDSPSSGNIII